MDLPAGIAEILGLFEEELRGVEFPDVGATALGQAAARVEGRIGQVAEAKAQLAAAEAELMEEREALLRLAERALAYLQVYAKEDLALSRRLSKIQLSAPAQPQKRRRKSAPAAPTGSPEPASLSAVG